MEDERQEEYLSSSSQKHFCLIPVLCCVVVGRLPGTAAVSRMLVNLLQDAHSGYTVISRTLPAAVVLGSSHAPAGGGGGDGLGVKRIHMSNLLAPPTIGHMFATECKHSLSVLKKIINL